MTLIKFNNRNRLFPWSDTSMQSFFDTDDFFSDDSLLPAMNVKEHDNDYEIEIAAPGFSKKDFEVTIDNNVLNICGEKKDEKEEEDEGYSRKEFSYNSFKRSLKLPDTINSDGKINATYKDGILKLNLLKKDDLKKTSKKVIEVI